MPNKLHQQGCQKKDLFQEVGIDNYDRFTDAYRDLE